MSEPVISARASELFRLELCPGSHRMQKGLPDQPSEISKKGDILHWYDAHPELSPAFLKPQDQELLKRAKELDDLVIERVNEQFDLKGKTFREERGTYGRYSQNGYEITGHPDRICFYDKLTVVLEKKFGFREQTPAETNKQCRAYSVIFAKNESVVGVLQPRMSFDERISIAHYTKDDLESSKQEIVSILKEASKPDAPLNPSEDACRYCRAARPELCPAFAKAMQVPAVLTPNTALSKAARTEFLEQRVAQFTDDQLSKTLLAIQLAGFAKDVVHDEARKRGETDFWKVAKEMEVREVVDVRRAMSLLSLAGLERADLFDCVQGLSLTKLEELIRKKNPNWKWQDAKDWVNTKLKSVIEISTRKGRLIQK